MSDVAPRHVSGASLPPRGQPVQPEPVDEEYGPPEGLRPAPRHQATEPDPQTVERIYRNVRSYEVAWEERHPPILFALPVRDKISEETFEALFAADGDPGAGGHLTYASLVQVTDSGAERVDLNAITRFFRRVLLDERKVARAVDEGQIAEGLADELKDGDGLVGFNRYVSIIDDPDVEVHMGALAEAVKDLVEDYAGRPLGLSSTLPRSQRRHGGRSTGRRR